MYLITVLDYDAYQFNCVTDPEVKLLIKENQESGHLHGVMTKGPTNSDIIVVKLLIIINYKLMNPPMAFGHIFISAKVRIF